MGNVILGWVICSEGVWTWSISLGELLDTGVNFVAALVTAAALVAGFRQMRTTPMLDCKIAISSFSRRRILLTHM